MSALRKALLGCGVVSSVLYLGLDVYAWSRYPGYSPLSQAYSELLAEGAPTRSLMLTLGAPYNPLVAALGFGVWLTPGRSRPARLTGVLLVLYALCSFLGGTVFQMDVRGTEVTPRGALHGPLTAVMVVFMLLAMGVGAFLRGRRWRLYSLGTLLTVIAFAGLAFGQAAQLAANEPTPLLGLIERVGIYAWMLWVAALALSLWRTWRLEEARMTAITALVKRHPVLTYYLLTFAISWGGMLLVIGGPGGLPGNPEQAGRLIAIAFSLLAGPSIAGLFVTGVVDGQAGLRNVLARLFRWRVGIRWYAVALLSAPLLATAIFAVLSRRSLEFVPPIVTAENKPALVLVAIAAGLSGGFLEELGWTGFVIPRLGQRHGVFATGIIVGVLWGAWHLLVNVWYSGVAAGGLPLTLFVPVYFLTGVAQLTAYRVLMVWVYDRTQSLLLAVLMHASLIVSTTPGLIPATTGIAFLTWFPVSAAVLWLVVAAVAVANRGQLTRPSLRLRTA